MLIWFWIILLVLHEGFGIDQPYREVNDTTTCQEIIKQPNYQTRLPCTGKDMKYHCLLNGNSTKEYEVCREWKWIPKGKCAYFNTYGSGNVDERDCEFTPDLPCADKEYSSADNTRYAVCYMKKEVTIVPMQETSTRPDITVDGGNATSSNSTQSGSNDQKGQHEGDIVAAIVFGILIPPLTGTVIFLIYHYKLLKCAKDRKNRDRLTPNQTNDAEAAESFSTENENNSGNYQNRRNNENLTSDIQETQALLSNENGNNAGNQQSETEEDAANFMTEDEEVRASPSPEENTGNTEKGVGSEGKHHPQVEKTAADRNKTKEVTENIEIKGETDSTEQKDSENEKVKMHVNKMLKEESACSMRENENFKEKKNQIFSKHDKDTSAQSSGEENGQKVVSPSLHAEGKLNNSASPLLAKANDAKATVNDKGHPIDRMATGEANSKDINISAESDRRGSLSDEQGLPGKEESENEKDGSTRDEGVSEEAADEKEGSTDENNESEVSAVVKGGSTGNEEEPTNTSDEYKTESASENDKGPVESPGKDKPTDVFDDTAQSLRKESVDKNEMEFCQELYEFLSEVFTKPARTLLKSVLSKNVEKSPAEVLKDASIQTELKQELPPEYHASISSEGEDNESVVILYYLLRKFLEEKDCPKSGWGKPVKSTDTGIGDDVERLCRVHTIFREISDPGKIPVENYERLLNVVFDAFKRLDPNGKYKDDHNNLHKKLRHIRNLHLWSQKSNAFVPDTLL